MVEQNRIQGEVGFASQHELYPRTLAEGLSSGHVVFERITASIKGVVDTLKQRGEQGVINDLNLPADNSVAPAQRDNGPKQ